MRIPGCWRRRSSLEPDRGASSVTVGLLVVATLAVGCLPSGTRGSGPIGGDSDDPGRVVSPGPTIAGSPTPRPRIVAPTPTPAPTFLVYTVKGGDSLNTIAHRFGTTARSIAFWNRSTYPSLDPDSATYRPGLLKIGWTLFLIPNDVVDEDAIPGPEPSDDGTNEDPADESATPG